MARVMRDRSERRRAEMEMEDVQASPFVADESLESLDASIRLKLDQDLEMPPAEVQPGRQ